jgi:hypothetical protein
MDSLPPRVINPSGNLCANDMKKLVLLFTLATTLALPVFSRAKTDVLVMNNGDRWTCEIKNLESGVLQVETDYVDGTISIDWFKVARIESSALFLVHMQDGSRYAGKLITREALPGTPMKIEIQPEDQTTPVVVDRYNVVHVTQFSESILRRFDGNITIGAVYSKGNNTTQYNFGSELDYRQERWGGKLDYTSTLSSSTGAPTATFNEIDLTAFRLLRWPNYFWGGGASLLQSSVREINRQTVVGLTLGRFLKNTNRMQFSVQGGFGWQRTQYYPSYAYDRLQNVAVAMISSDLDAFTFKKTRLNIRASVFPALTSQGRLFSRVNAAYYLKVFGKIDWNLSFYGNWDTQPPGNLSSSDYGTSTGLSYSFGNH